MRTIFVLHKFLITVEYNINMTDILKVENLTKKFKKKNLFSSNPEEVIAADSVNFSLEISYYQTL